MECHLAVQGETGNTVEDLGIFLDASQDPNVMDTDEGGVGASFELSAENKDTQMTVKNVCFIATRKILGFYISVVVNSSRRDVLKEGSRFGRCITDFAENHTPRG